MLFAFTVSTGSHSHADQTTIRIGFVTFLSIPVAEPIGVPATIAAQAIVTSLNTDVSGVQVCL